MYYMKKFWKVFTKTSWCGAVYKNSECRPVTLIK